MAPRRQRDGARETVTLRFRFAADGRTWRAVTANASASGAFVKASHVPAVGSRVLLEEARATDGLRPVRVLGEVQWRIPKATLDQPETGFGMSFVEAWASDPDGQAVRAFLGDLCPGLDLRVMREERDGAAIGIHRFRTAASISGARPLPEAVPAQPDLEVAEPAAAPPPVAAGAPATTSDPPEASSDAAAGAHPGTVTATPPAIEADRDDDGRHTSERDWQGVHASLSRLRRHGRPRTTTVTSVGSVSSRIDRVAPASPRATPATGISAAPPPVPPASRARTGPQQAVEAVRRPPNPTPVPAPPAPSAPPPVPGASDAERGAGGPRKRGITGIFSSFFGRAREDDGEDAGAPAPLPDRPPTPPVGHAVVGDVEIEVRWKGGRTVARLDRISETMASLVGSGDVPDTFERVRLRPVGRGRASELEMHGTVTRVKDPGADGRHFSIRLTKVDERGHSGVFQEYLRQNGGE